MAEKSYQLAQIVLDGIDEDVRCNEFTVTREMDTEERTATNDFNAYDVSLGKESITWSMDEVDPRFRKPITEIYNNQLAGSDRFSIATFDFNKATGELETDDVLYECYITNIEKTSANQPFSVEGGALNIKRE